MKSESYRLFMLAVLLTVVIGCATMQTRWEATKSADTIQAYEEFLKQYPQGDPANQARARLKELYEQKDWGDAKAEDTISSYEGFVRKYPQSRFGFRRTQG